MISPRRRKIRDQGRIRGAGDNGSCCQYDSTA
eukprot:jgi/Botrbrau1/1532/Bobra.0107s0020.1